MCPWPAIGQLHAQKAKPKTQTFDKSTGRTVSTCASLSAFSIMCMNTRLASTDVLHCCWFPQLLQVLFPDVYIVCCVRCTHLACPGFPSSSSRCRSGQLARSPSSPGRLLARSRPIQSVHCQLVIPITQRHSATGLYGSTALVHHARELPTQLLLPAVHQSTDSPPTRALKSVLSYPRRQRRLEACLPAASCTAFSKSQINSNRPLHSPTIA